MKNALAQFAKTTDFRATALDFFRELGYESPKDFGLPALSFDAFCDALQATIDEARVLAGDWKAAHVLFQFTADELGAQKLNFEGGADRDLFEAFVFVALELTGESYSRTQLANMAREINKPFASPVIVLFRHGASVTLAAVARRENRGHGEHHVLEKVSLLKDIRCENPHRAHLDILEELEKAQVGARNWAEFLAKWNAVLDLSALNKKFYRELSNWFFAAREYSQFPDPDKDAAERGLIRLITRLIFTWFIKERGLVPEALFQPEFLPTLLKHSDGESGSYYRAVLQNLFFATLNSEMGERRFRSNSGGAHAQQGDYGLSCYFRYENEFIAPEKWLELVRDVPFLNGGLFECLDAEDKDGARIDGFSDNAKRQAHLPNKLFWGEKFAADLSGEYGDARQKAVKVTPLLELLGSYKFTIDENTPLEEDVALDPELLGKVFENLLASYNPETKTTARKQTGSFYTPREIVNYMVEEALAAYLKTAAPEAAHVDGENDALRVLLSDADKRSAAEIGFSAAHSAALVTAIERCTVLDPACGSGAFPMGALAKMVLLLRKLDPHNAHWLDSQLRAVDSALENTGAERAIIEDAKQRVRDAFALNDPDYARKLYLIERCLFGVDIQAVALQISKLRFFIALIIDQQIKDDKPNRNIRALPNLETKFVAANTLISLPQSGALTPSELAPLERELADVRRQHIAPKKRADKKRLEARDAQLRGEIETLMKEAGFGASFVTPLVQWNPYDQNAVAPFFEPERMFGPELKDGFDIVIGNPPYVFARDSAAKGITAEDKKYYVANYKLAQYQINLYALFIEKSVNLLKYGGVLAFITPNNWLTINTNRVLREYVLHQSDITIVNFLKQVFESADVDAAVMIFNKGCKTPDTNVALYEWTEGLQEIKTTKATFFLSLNDFVINIEALKGNETHAILAKLETASKQLDKIANVKSGLKAYEVGKGSPPQTMEMKNSRVYHSSEKQAGWGKYLDGKDVCRYHFGWSGEYILYGDKLASPRTDITLFDSPRILVRQIPNKPPYCVHACYTDKRFFNDLNSMNIINIQEKPLFVLGVLNSKPTSWWFIHKFGKMQRGTFPQFKVNELATFPIPNATPEQQSAVVELVERVLAAKAEDAGADTSELEREIDVLVYALYGLNEVEIGLVEGGK